MVNREVGNNRLQAPARDETEISSITHKKENTSGNFRILSRTFRVFRNGFKEHTVRDWSIVGISSNDGL